MDLRLAVVNTAALNKGVWISSCDPDFSSFATKWAPRGARRDSKGEPSPLLPFDMKPDSLGETRWTESRGVGTLGR